MQKAKSLGKAFARSLLRDRRALVGVPLALGIMAFLSSLLPRRAVSSAAVGATVAGSGLWVAALQEDRARRSERSMERSMRSYTQDLHLLDSRLNNRKPLPRFGGWAISPDFGLLLLDALEEQRPQVIVEIGAGSSTQLMAMAVEMVGTETRIVSIEHDATYLARVNKELEKSGLGSNVSLVHAELVPHTIASRTYQWYEMDVIHQELSTLPGIDLLVVDGPPGTTGPMARFPALPLLKGYLADSCVILLDDADRRDESRILAAWKEHLPECEFRVVPTQRGTGVGFTSGQPPTFLVEWTAEVP